MLLSSHLVALSFTLAFPTSTPCQEDDRVVVEAQTWHLGNDTTPDWIEAAPDPQGTRLDLEFEGRTFRGEGTLVLDQRSVDGAWFVELNGTRVLQLERISGLETVHYAFAGDLLVDGVNTLSVVPEDPGDDVTLGRIHYFERSLREVLDLCPLDVRVSDGDSSRPLPVRVTFVAADGELPRLYAAQGERTAVRRGVCYMVDGAARVELPAGAYTVYATRGPEWSLGRAAVEVSGGREAQVSLSLVHEVDTTGFVACDTHVHTLTHSGHGDASMEERQVTLAGEGVELAIATDHNHNTDYRPLQLRMGLESYYTPVVGNEVTTPIGHLNGFPLNPEDEVPAYELRDIVRIVEGMRAKGAEVVILNHPRWPAHDTGPHGEMELDGFTGEWSGNWACPFDAVELINSETEELDYMLLFRDWFALLNRGEQVWAVGSSDSHTVGGVVGQGRTYVQSSSDDPSRLDVGECCANLSSGRSSIGMGIFADIRRRGTASGAASVLGQSLARRELGTLELRVAASSWVTPRRALLFANGQPIWSGDLGAGEAAGPTDLVLPIDPTLAWPKHDFWLVCLVVGDGVGGDFWPQLNDYTLAATNPVFFDVDGDGVVTRARALAERILTHIATLGGDRREAALEAALAEVDAAVAVQLLHLARREDLGAAHRHSVQRAEGALATHPELAEWVRGLEPPR